MFDWVPTARLGIMIVDCWVLPAKKILGVQEYVYCDNDGGMLNTIPAAIPPPGHNVVDVGLKVGENTWVSMLNEVVYAHEPSNTLTW